MGTQQRFSTMGGGEGASRRAGWSLFEAVLAMLILVLVLAGFSRGLASSKTLERTTWERGVASAAGGAKLEELRATEFEEVLARYDSDPGNDPLDGASPGAAFDVAGLRPRLDDPDGRVGEVVFPLSEFGELREDLELPRLGLPRDLTGDEGIDGLDHAGDYRLLPVLVRVEWLGSSRASLELVTVLKRMEREEEEP